MTLLVEQIRVDQWFAVRASVDVRDTSTAVAHVDHVADLRELGGDVSGACDYAVQCAQGDIPSRHAAEPTRCSRA